jgi:hypothetical protein
MQPGRLPMAHHSIPGSGLKARTVAVWRSTPDPDLVLSARPLFGGPGGDCGTSAAIPAGPAIGTYAVKATPPGHDVSGTGRQILERAMQSITTMMPVWQCGHSRNDCPVSVWKRSR